jgi:hypothetical protein
MNTNVFRTLLITYSVLLVATALFSVAIASRNPLPDAGTKEWEALAPKGVMDPELRRDVVEELHASGQRLGKLSDIAMNAFSVTIGAFLGFLSSVGAMKVQSEASKTKQQERTEATAPIVSNSSEQASESA